jgi:CubicO group peptidase (beta-lactamase class C family)
MAHHGVPGVGIAVVDGFEIQWARGYGVLEAGGTQAVTPETLFQVASICKPVVAATVLCLAETGGLDLDREVNEMLTSWRLPANEFTTKALVREILSSLSREYGWVAGFIL